MRNINLRYVEETYDADNLLTAYQVKCPADFNFAYDVVDDIAVNEPQRRAMLWCNPRGEEHLFTFADIKKYSDQTANYLSALGIQRGDMVLVVLKRHYQFWFVAPALEKIGAVMVPATFMLKKHDVEYRVNSASVKAIICTADGDTAASVDEAAPNCPSLTLKVLVGGQRPGWHDYNAELPQAPTAWQRQTNKITDPMLMYFSSGTSGYPKMVLHDHSYALGHLFTAKHWHNVEPDGLHFTIADTGWGKAVWGKYYGQWIMEACVFTYDFDKFNARDILAKIEKYRITTLCCPPTMFRFFLTEDVSQFDLSSLKYATIAGEALNPDIFNNWYKATGLKLMEGFGQTETTLTICNKIGMQPKPGSMGKPSPQFNIDIVDEQGQSCPPGTTGEIVISVKPRPVGLMQCYYRNPELTDKAIHDGYYHTGDTAWRDEDGYYWFVGRIDDIIKSSGYRIGPFEIESVLVEHPAVLECAITGVPDPLRGQVVKATVVLKPGYEPNERLVKELQTYVKKNTAPYKYPRVVEFVSELPKTGNGKIRRNAIREQK